MKTIGLLGGMSWESTLIYYKAINEGIKSALGGLHSAKICLYSVDFAEVESLQHQSRWQEAGILLTQAAQQVEAGGADFLLICTNTMHKVAEEIEKRLSIPLLHIADVTAEVLVTDGIRKVGLLGTQFTMQEDFYKQRLADYGLHVLLPHDDEQKTIHDIIYTELCLGKVKANSRSIYTQVVEDLSQRGAEAVILGCTEIALLLKPQHSLIPLYDTTTIHAQAAVKASLEGYKAH